MSEPEQPLINAVLGHSEHDSEQASGIALASGHGRITIGLDEMMTAVRASGIHPSRLAIHISAQEAVRPYEVDEDEPNVSFADDRILISPANNVVRVDEVFLDLTVFEFRLLNHMAQRIDTIRARQELLRLTAGLPVTQANRIVDTYIGRLRKKLGPEDLGKTEDGAIVTKFGVGYGVVSKLGTKL